MTCRFKRGKSADNGNGDSGDGNGARSGPFVKSDDKPDWPNHGGYAAVRLFKERNLDLRRADHRALHAWQCSLVEDLGGQAVVDAFQRSMIDRATELLIVISKMAEHVEARGIMQGDSLAPCLRSSFLQFVNSFRHTLTAAFEHSKTKPKKPLDLKDYLESNYAEKEDGKNDGSNADEKDERTDGSGTETRRRRYGTEGDEDPA